MSCVLCAVTQFRLGIATRWYGVVEDRHYKWRTCNLCLDDRIPVEVVNAEGWVTFESACEWAWDNPELPEAQRWALRANVDLYD